MSTKLGNQRVGIRLAVRSSTITEHRSWSFSNRVLMINGSLLQQRDYPIRVLSYPLASLTALRCRH
jgi:hypothetical protein